ncbi:histidine phosphatase family protein [Bacillus aquiflavi]|uniref:Histidine phosphatase family protein n=1 Tax=Bacillus aquiflavi TaxID=2672567 RepID=A0A6B3VY30_9BACI|nr:histidine phosphatase family protein [Bacillus aquiflavi]MBA4536850.1 histidine phosphatase family protein [Bacillus aquiflavi]NEY81217.1 histidine phosphatase family protein [Bacillus aquiflavi]
MDDCLAITLFRHGITDDNKRRAYIGWTNSPLSKSGVEQLLQLKPQLKAYELVFTSDLCRCVETASILFRDVAHEKINQLREIHFGEWEGKTFNELQHYKQYQKWLSHPLMYRPPNGETFSEFTTRIEGGWNQITEKIIREKSRKIAVVTHGGVIRYLLSTYAPVKRDFWEWTVQHGQGYELIWPLAAFRRGERCTSLQAVPLMAKENG